VSHFAIDRLCRFMSVYVDACVEGGGGAARLILWSLLRGQTLRSSILQTSWQAPCKRHRNTGICEGKGMWSRREIWPPGSQRGRWRHVPSHSPVAKSLRAAILMFVHLCELVSSDLREGDPARTVFFRGRIPQGLAQQKTLQNKASRDRGNAKIVTAGKSVRDKRERAK